MTLRLNGSTSGSVSLDAPAAGGNVSLELPTDSIKPGLVLVAAQSFTGVSSVSVNNCFTATYENYRVLVNMSSLSAGMTIGMRLRAGGADDSVAGYDTYYIDIESTSSAVGRILGQTSWQIAAGASGYQLSIGADVRQPYTANHKHVQDIWGPTVEPSGTYWRFGLRGHVRASTTLYDGFSLLASTGNFTGTVSVYGYRSTV